MESKKSTSSNKKSKLSFSGDFCQLFKIKCNLHKNDIYAICLSPNCENERLLCQQCIGLHIKNEEDLPNHKFQTMKLFLQDSIKTLEKNINDHKIKKSIQMKELDKFSIEAVDNLLIFVKCINEEKAKISKDYNAIQNQFQIIMNNCRDSFEYMRGHLDSMVKEVGLLINEIRFYSYGESPIQQKLKSEPSLKKLYDDVINLQSETESTNQLKTVFKNLIDVFNSKLASKPFAADLEKQKDIDNVMSHILNLLAQIRNKVIYPPKYKHFQNAVEKFKGFMKTLTELKESSKNMNNYLLMSQSNLNLQLNCLENETFYSESKFKKPDLDLKTIEYLTLLKSTHYKGITCMSSFGKDQIITGSFDHIIRLFNIKTFKETSEKFLNLIDKVPSCVLTLHDEKQNPKFIIAGLSDGFVVVCDPNFKKEVIFKEHESLVSSLLFLKDGEILISASFDSSIVAYDLLGKSVIWKKNEHESINCLEKYDNELFLSGSDDCMIKFWNINKSKKLDELKSIQNDDSLNFIKLCKCNKDLIVCNGYNKINIWNLNTMELVGKFKAHRESILNAYIIENPISKIPAYSFDIANNNHQIKNNNYEFHSLDLKNNDNNKVQEKMSHIFKNPIFLLTFGGDHKIKLWDLLHDKELCNTNYYSADIDLNDSNLNVLFVKNEKDDSLYFLNSINKDNKLSLWKLN